MVEKHTNLLFGVVIVHLGPGILDSTSDEFALNRIESHTGNIIRKNYLLQELARIGSTVKVDRFASCNAENVLTLTYICYAALNVGELAGANLAINLLLLDDCPSVQIPPANKLIITSGDKDVGVASPDYSLDGSLVNARSDFKSLFGTNKCMVGSTRSGGGRGNRRDESEVED